MGKEAEMTNREIDALVAEKVFLKARCMCGLHVGDKAWTAFTHEGLPCYSTDPAASKKLRDRMRDLGWWCQMRNEWHPGNPECWAGFTPHGATGWNGRPDHWTSGPTEEMAVALAALAALGVEVK